MKQSLANDAVKLTSSKVITLIISMLSAMILSRFRTLAEYGTYSQLLLVINLTTSIFMIGLPNSINYFLAKAESDYERNKFLSVYYTLSTFLSLFSGLILVLSVPLIVSYFNNSLIRNFIYVLAVYPWTKIILASIENILIIYHKTTNLVLIKVLHSMFTLLAVGVVEVFGLDFSTYMKILIIIESLFTIWVYIIVCKCAGILRVSLNKKIIKSIFKFSIPIGLASVVSTLNIELDKLLIGNLFTTEQLAIYTNAAREMPVTIIASSLTAVLMPQLVKLLKQNKIDSAIRLWGEATELSFIFIAFIAFTLYTFAPEVIDLLYSDKYLPGVPVFRVYSLVLLLRCTYFGIVLNSLGKTRFILVSSLASLGLNAVLNYLFYFIFGYIGPAIATFISILIIALLQIIITSRKVNIPLSRILPWKSLIYISLINIIFGCLLFLLKKVIYIERISNEIIESIILGLLWAFLYILVMLSKIKQKWKLLNNHE